MRRKEGAINTGIALHNSGITPLALRLELRTREGQEIATSSIAEFAAGAHLARFIDELFPNVDSPDLDGTLVVHVEAGRVAATVLVLSPTARRARAPLLTNRLTVARAYSSTAKEASRSIGTILEIGLNGMRFVHGLVLSATDLSNHLSCRHLTRISHRRSTTSPQSSALAVFRSVGLLDVLYKYDCGGLGRKPCQDGPCDASLRQAMRNAG